MNDSEVSADLALAQLKDVEDYDRVMGKALAREPFLFSIGGRYLTRDEAHDRDQCRETSGGVGE